MENAIMLEQLPPKPKQWIVGTNNTHNAYKRKYSGILRLKIAANIKWYMNSIMASP